MRVAKLGIGAAALAALLFAIGAFGPGGSRNPATTAATANVRPDPIAALEDKVATGEATARDFALLALNRLGRVRTESDPTLIPEAQHLIDRSFAAQGADNFAALTASASLANASHDFSGSVRWARRAIEVNPDSAAPYGILGDALFELGHYERAETAYQKMVDTRPDVGSYVRAAYARQSRGDKAGSLQALRLALDATEPVGETAAFLHHQIGDVFHKERRYRRSIEENRTGVRAAPGFTPPTVGVAEGYIAQGKLRKALPIMRSAVKAIPSIEYFGTLGDILRALGRASEARTAYADAAERLKVYRRSGVNPDVDFILFYADHGLRPKVALQEARGIYRNRPTAAAADALGWILHKTGHDAEAARFAEMSLRKALSPDARFYFHAGAIAASTGHRSMAIAHLHRAFRINPNFSLFHEGAAERLLHRLQARPRMAR
ncbi:MAG: hypothetical protein LC808_11405 [Actinobacteria bacterium]|nr:hypothetical protein [Actinomycetota bacterium]